MVRWQSLLAMHCEMFGLVEYCLHQRPNMACQQVLLLVPRLAQIRQVILLSHAGHNLHLAFVLIAKFQMPSRAFQAANMQLPCLYICHTNYHVSVSCCKYQYFLMFNERNTMLC